MKTKGLIMVAVLISCFLGIHGAWAETKGYIDSGHNTLIGYGVVGAEYTGTAFDGSAIYGLASATSGYTCGGYFKNSSTSGMGVYAYAPAVGGYFQSTNTSGIGVSGLAGATSGVNYGGSFGSGSTSGTGVRGYAYAHSGTNYGGYFQSYSTSGKGVFGYASETTGYTYGGEFQSKSTSGKGVFGYASATTGQTYGGFFRSSSTSGKGVFGVARAISGQTYGVYGQTYSPSGYGVFSQGNMKVVGKLTVTGTKSAVVKLKNGESVSLYAVEASENWFEDFGSSTLKEGSALVRIEPTFAETVNTDMEYHVFLTPRGECKGLYVTNQKGTSFEVRELNGGKSDISFSYRIVAKRKGLEKERLAKVIEDDTTAMTTAEEENTQKEEAIELVSHVK